jgi:hypothetical protein
MTQDPAQLKELVLHYYRGRSEGIEQFAHWRDGVQYVGTTGKTLNVALAELHMEQQSTLEAIDRLPPTLNTTGSNQ